jgi:hypothetical protein
MHHRRDFVADSLSPHVEEIRQNAERIRDERQECDQEDGSQWFWTHDFLSEFAESVLVLLVERQELQERLEAAEKLAVERAAIIRDLVFEGAVVCPAKEETPE